MAATSNGGDKAKPPQESQASLQAERGGLRHVHGPQYGTLVRPKLKGVNQQATILAEAGAALHFNCPSSRHKPSTPLPNVTLQLRML